MCKGRGIIIRRLQELRAAGKRREIILFYFEHSQLHNPIHFFFISLELFSVKPLSSFFFFSAKVVLTGESMTPNSVCVFVYGYDTFPGGRQTNLSLPFLSFPFFFFFFFSFFFFPPWFNTNKRQIIYIEFISLSRDTDPLIQDEEDVKRGVYIYTGYTGYIYMGCLEPLDPNEKTTWLMIIIIAIIFIYLFICFFGWPHHEAGILGREQ